MTDGSITFSTALDNKELEKEYTATVKKIQRLTDKISAAQTKRSPAADQSKAVAAELDAAKAQLDYMKSGQEFFTSGAIQQQSEAVKSVQKDWDKTQAEDEKYDSQIVSANAALAASKEKAGAIASELSTAGVNADAMGEATKKVNRHMTMFKSMLDRTIIRATSIMFIYKAIQSVFSYIGDVVKVTPEASKAVAQLKGALLTLAQPLVNVIIPALTAFIQVLTQVIMAIARVLSALSGKTIDQSEKSAQALNDETTALDRTSKAAKKASKSLAAFDEINQLSSADSGTSIGSSSTDSAITPDFSGLDDASAKLKTISDLVLAVATGLLLWKISSVFTTGLLNTTKLFVGLAMAIGGCIEYIKSFTDAWNNGVDWENLTKNILSTTGLLLGLGIIGGKTAVAFGLIAIGCSDLVLGFHDVMDNGANLQNTLLIIKGLLEGGIGLSILTKSWIPLALAGIASLIYFAAYATGHAQELMQGVNDFLAGTFTGDWALAWTGIKEIALAVWDSIRDGAKLLWTKLTTKMATAAKWMQDNVWTPLDKKVNEFADNVHLTWIKFINELISAVESFANFFIGGINDIIGAINSMIQAAANALAVVGISVQAPQIPDIPEIALPRLATGAVIPANREFMAVLGDQKSGTNLEAPEDLIRQIVREESGGGNADILKEILSAIKAGKVLMLNRQELGKTVYDLYGRESNRVGISLVRK